MHKLPCCRDYFILDQELEFSERTFLEYKAYSLNLAEKYALILKATICSMLNCGGGSILLGIEESKFKCHIVKGIRTQEGDLLEFQSRLKANFQPQITSQLKISTKPVLIDKKSKRGIGRQVVKIEIKPLKQILFGFRYNGDLLIFKREESQTRKLISPAEIYQQIIRKAEQPPFIIHQCA